MMARFNLLVLRALAALLLMLLTCLPVQAQIARAPVGMEADAARVPPPGGDDPDNPINNAVLLSQSVPTAMTAGSVYTVIVNMKNTGTTTWTSAGNYRLGSANPMNNVIWGGARVGLNVAVPPGGIAQFTFPVTAPATPGSYNFQWAMLQESVAWFGAASTNVVVAVTAPPTNGAQFVSQSVPATMAPGNVYPVTVVMQNTGTTTWTAHGDRGLASANPLANNTWNAVRIDQPTTTAPGQTANYTFQVTAPAAPGIYNFQWKMVQDQIEWFGAESPNLSIQVAAQADTVTYIHTDALGSPVARSDSAGNIISRTSYEPYGRTASGVTPTTGFTGHVNDADTGLVYMQQRYYDPVAGRFLSVDPVTTDASTGSSFNRYVYANNSPYKFIDPDGRVYKLVGSQNFKKEMAAQIAENKKTAAGKESIDTVSQSKHVFVIQEGYGSSSAAPTDRKAAETPGKGSGGILLHDPNAKPVAQTADGPQPTNPATVLGHEFSHLADYARGTLDSSINLTTGNKQSEERAVEQENRIRAERKEPERTEY